MDDWEYVTIHRSDGIWRALKRRDIAAAAVLDELLVALETDGWERTRAADTYTGSDLSRVRLRHHLLPA
jgi:hypothetical protein